jgi:hypothetical protein
MGTVWNSNTGKSNANNLPAPTDVSKNPYGKKKFFCFGVSQKSATLVPCGIPVELEPTWPIYEKCPHLWKKGGAHQNKGIFGIGCPVQYFCFLLAYKASLALYAKRKQKYQNGNIHRKLKVSMSTISLQPNAQYRIAVHHGARTRPAASVLFKTSFFIFD